MESIVGKLSDFVQRDYTEELEIVKDSGTIWKPRVCIASIVIGYFGAETAIGDQIAKWEFTVAAFAIWVFPHAWKKWKQYSVASTIRHAREVRLEVKVDALLGLINIQDDKTDSAYRIVCCPHDRNGNGKPACIQDQSDGTGS